MTTDESIDESVTAFLDGYREQYPELFKSQETIEAIKVIAKALGLVTAKTARLVITANIVKGIQTFAKYDLSTLEATPMNEGERQAILNDPDAFIRVVLTGTWNAAMDLIEGIGYSNLDIIKFLEGVDEGVVDSGLDDIKFTSKVVGKA